MRFSSFFRTVKELRSFLMLWSTQALSRLGSSMTGFALGIYLYQQTGSALSVALTSICSYTPYVLMSIFAGALTDRWNKRVTMLVCDALAAASTIVVLFLIQTNLLQPWHLYVINAISGLMDTVQSPASDVAVTLLTPKGFYQRASGLRSLSGSLIGIISPVLAAALMGLGGMGAVIAVDLSTFMVAFLSLLLLIRIPEEKRQKKEKSSILADSRAGLRFLRQNPGLLALIAYLAAINLVASVNDAARTPLLLSREGGGQTVLGLTGSITGIATLLGSLLATLLPAPKNRVRAVHLALLFSMSTENLFLAFGREAGVWCVGMFLGWIAIPLMNANLDYLMRANIPVEMQGRVFACRNSLQFFTIPLGMFAGGALVDNVFEPLMASQSADSPLVRLFGPGKGSGAALLFALIGVLGVSICLIFGRVRALKEMEG